MRRRGLGALDSFFRRAERGQFPQLQDRDDLWQLLFVLTVRQSNQPRSLPGTKIARGRSCPEPPGSGGVGGRSDLGHGALAGAGSPMTEECRGCSPDLAMRPFEPSLSGRWRAIPTSKLRPSWDVSNKQWNVSSEQYARCGQRGGVMSVDRRNRRPLSHHPENRVGLRSL